MQIKSNEIFDFRYDSIWTERWKRKPWTGIVENEEFTKRHHKRDSQIFLPSRWIISLWNWPTYKWPIFFMTAEAVFVSNNIYIESYSNRIDIESKSNRIERFLHLVNRKSNLIETNSIWQPWSEPIIFWLPIIDPIKTPLRCWSFTLKS
jgi:hypothetical protein